MNSVFNMNSIFSLKTEIKKVIEPTTIVCVVYKNKFCKKFLDLWKVSARRKTVVIVIEL